MINNKLKEIRQRKDLTQIQLANLAQVSVQWIQKIEQGVTSGVKDGTKKKIAAALGVNKFEIFPELRRELEIFSIVKTWLPDLTEDEELRVKEILSRMKEEELAEIICSGMDEETALKIIKKYAKKYGIRLPKKENNKY